MTTRSGCMKSWTAVPSASELRVGDVADVRRGRARRVGAHLLARADRHRALHRDHDRGGRPAAARRRPSRRPRGRRHPSTSAACRRDVDDVRAVDGLVDLGREGQPLAVALEQLGEARLVDRHLASLERVDLLRDDVADDDVVPELGEARPGDEADVAGAEDGDLAHAPTSLPAERLAGPWRSRASSRSRARSRSVLTTQ